MTRKQKLVHQADAARRSLQAHTSFSFGWGVNDINGLERYILARKLLRASTVRVSRRYNALSMPEKMTLRERIE